MNQLICWVVETRSSCGLVVVGDHQARIVTAGSSLANLKMNGLRPRMSRDGSAFLKRMRVSIVQPVQTDKLLSPRINE